jgi:hypothetical protein
MHRICIVASLLFAACGPSASGGSGQAPSTTSGTPNPTAATEPPESDVHCTREVRTGTHMEKTICRSEAEKEQDRRAAQEIYLTPNSRPGFP